VKPATARDRVLVSRPQSHSASIVGSDAPRDVDEEVYVQDFTVSFRYPVYFTHGSLDPCNPVLARALSWREPARRHRFFAAIDAGVARAWPRLEEDLAYYADRHSASVELAAPPEIVSGGESAKNDPRVVERLQRRFFETSIDRRSIVLIVGGGALLDVVGYAAATTHRGVRIVRMPTTVAAQNDSGVGVKTGVNAFHVKNFIGTFYPPFAVINDAAFLDTLPARDRIAGMAEAVKVALIRDREFFDWLWTNRKRLASFETDAVRTMVRRSALLHLRHIGGSDPFESGESKPLDHGHWAAHKLEALSQYALRHGEAVAIGVALDSRYACETGLLADEVSQRICALLEHLGFTLWHQALGERDATGRLWVLDGLREFREHLGGNLSLTMLRGIGDATEIHSVDEAAVELAIGWLRTRAGR
jgi:3-dehydroquinate synthase